MDNELNHELAREAGIEYRRVTLTCDAGGAIAIEAHDMGPTVQEVWDHDDYEFGVTVPAASVALLAFALLKEKFAGDLPAVDALRDFCQKHEIPYTFHAWP
jgi:hypothetical protein